MHMCTRHVLPVPLLPPLCGVTAAPLTGQSTRVTTALFQKFRVGVRSSSIPGLGDVSCGPSLLLCLLIVPHTHWAPATACGAAGPTRSFRDLNLVEECLNCSEGCRIYSSVWEVPSQSRNRSSGDCACRGQRVWVCVGSDRPAKGPSPCEKGWWQVLPWEPLRGLATYSGSWCILIM